jgi:Ca2+:H+ antiporter
LAIVPLAKWMGTATEELSVRTGPGIGGLLNASFGNATELIIALFALHAGLIDVVKASITGSIIGNILFVLGLALLMGGLRRERQRFNQTAAGISASQLMLSVIALVIPAAFSAASGQPAAGRELIESELVAVFLIVGYVLSLLFSLRTHPHIYKGEQEEHANPDEAWTVRKAVVVLALATVGVAIMAEALVASVEGVTHQLGWSELFIGVILIPIIGNAAEHLTAVTVAMKDKVDLSLGIAIGSSTQVALLITPLLVFASLFLGHPMNLLFRPIELVSIAAAVLIVNIISLDGESNWLEGAQLLLAYGIIAVAFFVYV